MKSQNEHAPLALLTEPRGEAYSQLLRLARKHCTTFSLVRRPKMRWAQEAENVLTHLSPFLEGEQLLKQWPGTTSAKPARVFRFTLTRESAAVLEVAQGLFDWQQPYLPEDLAFYTAEGKVWMWSCAHERLAQWGSADIAAQSRLQLPQL